MQNVFTHTAPEQVIDLVDKVFGRIGFVVIDRLVNGSASGGIRYSQDVTIDEVSRLARVMSMKWAFLNIPMGGGKIGLIADLDALGCSRERLMEAFGHSLASLVQESTFYPGIDLGTTFDDLKIIMDAAGRPLDGEQIDGSWSTALTVFETIRQLADGMDRPLKGMRIALEGFGKVGSRLAEKLCNEGAILVAISTRFGGLYAGHGLDITELLALKSAHGDQLVDHFPAAQKIPIEELVELPVDLLIPGARPDVIHADNVDRVQAQMIVPIANIPYRLEMEDRLSLRGVKTVPDFVANCGGILASGLHSFGFDLDDTRDLIEFLFGPVVRTVIQEAKRQGRPIREIAEAAAWANHAAFTQPTPSEGRGRRLLDVIRRQGLIGLYRRAAWRLFHSYPVTRDVVRRAALQRYGEIYLANTLARLQSNEVHG